MRQAYDITIVGNGVLAYSSAFALLQTDPSLKIAIIGPQNRYGSGTNAAGAMLNTFAEVTHKTFTSSAGKIKFSMALQAAKLWPKWVAQLNSLLPSEQQLQVQLGTFVLLNAKSGQLDCENYHAIIKTLKFYEEVEGKDIPGMNPFEDARPLNSLYIPREGYINPELVLSALELILQSYPNITFLDDTATTIRYKMNRVVAIVTKQGKILFTNRILLVAGAYSQALIDFIPEIRDQVPRIFAGVGYSLFLKQSSKYPISHVIRTPNRSGACGLHVLPRTNNSLYVGASNNVYFKPQEIPTAGLMSFLLTCVIEQINQEFYKSEFMGWQVGNRPVTIDTFPLIGETSLRGLWLLTGTYRDGFHLSPLLAQHIALEILEQPGLFKNHFLPERPLIQTMTKEESINEYILH